MYNKTKNEEKKNLTKVLEGIFEVISQDLLKQFDEKELEVLVSGVSEIDVDDWQHNSFCKGYDREDQVCIYVSMYLCMYVYIYVCITKQKMKRRKI